MFGSQMKYVFFLYKFSNFKSTTSDSNLNKYKNIKREALKVNQFVKNIFYVGKGILPCKKTKRGKNGYRIREYIDRVNF